MGLSSRLHFSITLALRKIPAAIFLRSKKLINIGHRILDTMSASTGRTPSTYDNLQV
jgi:hypothetical protein